MHQEPAARLAAAWFRPHHLTRDRFDYGLLRRRHAAERNVEK